MRDDKEVKTIEKMKKKLYILGIVLYGSLFLGTAYCVGHNYDDMLPSESQLGIVPFGPSENSGDNGIEAEDVSKYENISDAAPVHVKSAPLPRSFRGTHENVITNAKYLNKVFYAIANAEKNVRILHIGDSHIKGNVLPKTLGAQLKDTWGSETLEGVDPDCSPELDGGITFNYLGLNGARTSRFCEDDMMDRIEAYRPDLVIVSFGTNEAHGNYDVAAHRRTLETLLSAIRRKCPGVVFLLTTPPGSYLRGVPNPHLDEAAQMLLQYGREHNIAVWDVFGIGGGADFACKNWQMANLMQADRIHFTYQGYELQGQLFAEAILKAYNQYLAGKQ